MADLSKIKLPSGTTYNIKDNNALPLTGGSVTGPVSFGDSVSIDEATIGDLVVNDSASFTNNIQTDTINGVTVGSSPKFTDTNTHRPIQMNGTEILGNNTTALNLKAGTNVSLSNSSGTVTINATDTIYESKAAASGGTAVSLVTTGEKYTWNSKTSNTGTVTKVTAGTGLSIGTTAGGNFTTTGTINHTNSVTAQTTQAVYPIKIDAQGHISAYGSAVTIPTVPSNTASSTTGISISNHATGTVIGVQSSTTTASKATAGTAVSIPNVTSAGSASNWVFENITVPVAASATACDDITSWSAGSGSASLTMAIDSSDSKKLNITFSHTHTAPTLQYTARSIAGVSGSVTASHVKSGGNGTAPTLGTAISITPYTFSDVTVPIKNTSASTFVTGTTHTITDNGHTHSIS